MSFLFINLLMYGKYRLQKEDDNLLFENKQLIIKYIENDNKDGYYDFSVEIKDFDTPNINLKFDYDKGKIVTMWIDIYEDENEPKNHVVYKLFDLCKYDISTILKFMIEHK